MKRLFVNRKEKTNPGDWWSTPKHYFDDFKNDDWIDIYDLETIDLNNYDKIILGGGGLLFNTNFEKYIELLREPEVISKVILWGVGVNIPYSKHATKDNIQNDLNKFNHNIEAFSNNQLFIRDKQEKYNIVPCASCLHPIFDEQIEETREHLVINHIKLNSFRKEGFFRDKHNINCIGNKIENIVKDIKKSRIVYSQSYHGAYWAALCGKRAIIYRPWSTKFLYCDFPVKVLQKKGYYDEENEIVREDHIDIPKPNINYLKECREKNLRLYENINSNNLEQ